MIRHSIKKRHLRDLMVGENQDASFRIYLGGEVKLPVDYRYQLFKRDTRI